MTARVIPTSRRMSMKAITIINAPWGIGLGARHITVSTSGLAPQIKQLPDARHDFREFLGAEAELGGPDLRLNGVIDRVTLQAAINELPPGYKVMFILHDIEGYNHDEIAEMFGCSAGNSKSQVHKARMRLRELLQNAIGRSSHRHRRSMRNSPALSRLKYISEYVNA